MPLASLLLLDNQKYFCRGWGEEINPRWEPLPYWYGLSSSTRLGTFRQWNSSFLSLDSLQFSLVLTGKFLEMFNCTWALGFWKAAVDKQSLHPFGLKKSVAARNHPSLYDLGKTTDGSLVYLLQDLMPTLQSLFLCLVSDQMNDWVPTDQSKQNAL